MPSPRQAPQCWPAGPPAAASLRGPSDRRRQPRLARICGRPRKVRRKTVLEKKGAVEHTTKQHCSSHPSRSQPGNRDGVAVAGQEVQSQVTSAGLSSARTIAPQKPSRPAAVSQSPSSAEAVTCPLRADRHAPPRGHPRRAGRECGAGCWFQHASHDLSMICL